RRLSRGKADGLRAAAADRRTVQGVQGDVRRLHREVRRQGQGAELPRQGRVRGAGGMIKALIFDCDGWLADTERDSHRVGFNLAFREMAIDAEWDVELYGRLLL